MDEDAGGLRQHLAEDDAGHHGVAGKMPLEEPLLRTDVALAVGFAVHQLALVDEEHIVPMGQNLFEFFLVHACSFLMRNSTWP